MSEGLPIEVTCRVVGVSVSGFYMWRRRTPSPRAVRHAMVAEVIRQVHVESHQTYGARRVHAELVLGRKMAVARCTVELVMRRLGLAGLPGRPKYRIEAVGAEGFLRLRSAYPGAIVQCPVDFLAPLVLAAPKQARAVLQMLADWGITRFSVAWDRESTRSLVRQLEEWGYELNLYAVPNHESFLQAMLMMPRSLTADFNFPEWNYYGRGSGERRRYHRYPNRSTTAA